MKQTLQTLYSIAKSICIGASDYYKGDFNKRQDLREDAAKLINSGAVTKQRLQSVCEGFLDIREPVKAAHLAHWAMDKVAQGSELQQEIIDIALNYVERLPDNEAALGTDIALRAIVLAEPENKAAEYAVAVWKANYTKLKLKDETAAHAAFIKAFEVVEDLEDLKPMHRLNAVLGGIASEMVLERIKRGQYPQNKS